MNFLVKIAGVIIEIHAIHKLVYYYCREYWITNESPDFIVSITEKEVEEERILCYSSYTTTDLKSNQYLYGRIELMLVLRKIADRFLEYDIVLVHGTVVYDGQRGILLSAPSGTGKTTRAKRLMAEKPGIEIINGDKPFLKIIEGQTIAYGTPWCGKEFYNKNQVVPINTILLLERSENTFLEEVSFTEALPFLINQTYFPPVEGGILKVINLLKQMKCNVKIIRYCSRSDASDIIEAYNYCCRCLVSA